LHTLFFYEHTIGSRKYADGRWT